MFVVCICISFLICFEFDATLELPFDRDANILHTVCRYRRREI